MSEVSYRGATTSGFSADVVVIGSGAGGAAVAGAVATAGLHVLVIEAGPRRTDPAGSHVRNLDPGEQGLERFASFTTENMGPPSDAAVPPPGLPGLFVLHGVGGMLVAWTHNCPSPHPDELARCISNETWERLLAQAAQLLHVHTDLETGGVRMNRMLSRVASAVGPLPASRETQPMPIAAQYSDGVLRFAGAEDLLWPDGDRSRVNVLSDLVVQEVLHDGSRATGILARRRGCPQDPQIVVQAEATVVAAGTFGSAQILEASRVDTGPALGRYLMDHPSVISRVPLREDILRDVPLDDPTFTVWVPYSPDHPWQQIVQRTVPHLSPHPVGVEPRETADIVTFHPTEAREDNRLIFDRTATDPFGLPTARAAWALSQADRRAVARGLAEHWHIAAEIGDLARGWVPSLSKVGSSTHLMGSCRMGPTDDGTSVVNAEGRLWRYENLYVAGNAVLSTPNAANPTLTTVAAALHCAEAIVRDSACAAR